MNITEQKQLVNDLWDLWEKLAEHGEIYIGKTFADTHTKLQEQVKKFNYIPCCKSDSEQLLFTPDEIEKIINENTTLNGKYFKGYFSKK